eukprot:TRINITY_DN653_c0_g2_i2.p1 TRINITY_DN653_c0_g2~~TRINITY_DN653_c0_g2_i2.p1  ORF type:complete len:222 (+),score=-63.07 TRINITY_DN653_c0_g2_i2:289-954(+)
MDFRQRSPRDNGLRRSQPPQLVGGSTLAKRTDTYNLTSRCRNINLLCIVYACRPRLSSRLTLGGFTFPRKPQAFGGKDFHLPYRYSYRHSRLHALQQSLRSTFNAACNALLPNVLAGVPAASVFDLFPIIYGATLLDQQAITHFLNGGCFQANILAVSAEQLPTELSRILGPQRTVWVVSLLTAKIIPRGLTPEIVSQVFGVWQERVAGQAHVSFQSLYPL